MDTKKEDSKEKLSLGLAFFIAICIVTLFCLISLAVAKNLDSLTKEQQTNYFALPHDRV